MIVQLSGEMSGNSVIGPAITSYGATHGLPSGIVDRLCLIVDELAANVIMHAQADSLKLSFQLSCGNRSVTVCVRDNGHPFDPTRVGAARLDQPIEQREVGGLGLHFVRAFSDSLDYRRVGGENLVRATLRY